MFQAGVRGQSNGAQVPNSRLAFLMQRQREGGGVSARPLHDTAQQLGFANGAAVHAIIAGRHDLEADYANPAVTDHNLVVRAVENFYWYGRRHWTWVSAAHMADDALLRGQATKAFCEQFNNNFKYFAVNVLKLPGSDFTHQEIKGRFVTKECTVIDSNWKGNLLLREQLKNCYVFENHYFLGYKQSVIDVCTNRVSPLAGHVDDMVWFRFEDEAQANYIELRKAGLDVYRAFCQQLEDQYQTGGVYTIQQRTANLQLYGVNLINPAWRMIEIDEKMQGGDRYFTTWLLTDQGGLSAPSMQRLKAVNDRRTGQARIGQRG